MEQITHDTDQTEAELVEALRSGDRDPFDDADDVQHPDKYTIHCVHYAQDAEVIVEYHYAGGATDHGKAMEPYSANVLQPEYGDNGYNAEL